MRTNTTTLRLSAGALALFIALSPLAGYAKENDNKGKGKSAQVKVEVAERKAEKDSKENRENGKKVVSASVNASTSSSTKNAERKSCIKAFGHLIAPGWIKKNGSTSISDDCWLPFGIAKKFRGGPNGNGTSTPTTTPDTTGPVISSINSSPKQTVANITWSTNEKADSTVFYATTSGALDVNSSTTPRAAKSALEKDHNVKIENLATSTTYYFKVASKDAAGNTTYSDTMSFTTKAPDAVVTYPVISQIVTLNGTSTVNIAWKTNEAATSKVYYGTSTVDTNASTTPFVLDSNLVTNHSMLVSGLSTSTAYTFVIESKNASGNATLSNSFSLTTNN